MISAYYRRNHSSSRSFNAECAEEGGRFSASKFKQVYGIDPRRFIKSHEWHHVSKYANMVDYYDIEDLMDVLAEMPYNERKKAIGNGKFKAYWMENRKYYLAPHLIHPADFFQKRIKQPFRISGHWTWLENAVDDVEIEVTDDRYIFKAVRKRYADYNYHQSLRPQPATPPPVEKKRLEKFDLPRQYVKFEGGRPVSAYAIINNWHECEGLDLENEPPIYYDIDVRGYDWRLSSRGGRVYFEKK